MKKTILKFFLFILGLAFMSFMGFKMFSYEEKLPTASSENSKIIYNKLSNRLISYNINDQKIEQDFNFLNFMQYSFNTQDNYYTSGHSYNNNFEILKINNNKIEKVYKPDNSANVAIFPFASDSINRIYLFVNYDSNGTELERNLIQFKENNLIHYKNIAGIITNGVICNDNLYFTIYNKSTDTFSLSTIPINSYNANPELLAEGLENGELFNYNNDIYVSNENYIYNNTNTFEKKHINEFFDDYLIQMYVDENGDGILEIYSINEHKIIKKYPEAIGYEIYDNVMTIFCHNKLETFQF